MTSAPFSVDRDPGPAATARAPNHLRWRVLGARLILAGIFIYASLDKIAHPAAFAKDVYNYQILPDALINLTALVLPWLELFLGLCLLAGIWLPGAVLTVSGLLIVFHRKRASDRVPGRPCVQPGPGARHQLRLLQYRQRGTGDVRRLVPAAGRGVSRRRDFSVLRGFFNRAPPRPERVLKHEKGKGEAAG